MSQGASSLTLILPPNEDAKALASAMKIERRKNKDMPNEGPNTVRYHTSEHYITMSPAVIRGAPTDPIDETREDRSNGTLTSGDQAAGVGPNQPTVSTFASQSSPVGHDEDVNSCLVDGKEGVQVQGDIQVDADENAVEHHHQEIETEKIARSADAKPASSTSTTSVIDVRTPRLREPSEGIVLGNDKFALSVDTASGMLHDHVRDVRSQVTTEGETEKRLFRIPDLPGQDSAPLKTYKSSSLGQRKAEVQISKQKATNQYSRTASGFSRQKKPEGSSTLAPSPGDAFRDSGMAAEQASAKRRKVGKGRPATETGIVVGNGVSAKLSKNSSSQKEAKTTAKDGEVEDVYTIEIDSPVAIGTSKHMTRSVTKGSSRSIAQVSPEGPRGTKRRDNPVYGNDEPDEQADDVSTNKRLKGGRKSNSKKNSKAEKISAIKENTQNEPRKASSRTVYGASTNQSGKLKNSARRPETILKQKSQAQGEVDIEQTPPKLEQTFNAIKPNLIHFGSGGPMNQGSNNKSVKTTKSNAISVDADSALAAGPENSNAKSGDECQLPEDDAFGGDFGYHQGASPSLAPAAPPPANCSQLSQRVSLNGSPYAKNASLTMAGRVAESRAETIPLVPHQALPQTPANPIRKIPFKEKLYDAQERDIQFPPSRNPDNQVNRPSTESVHGKGTSPLEHDGQGSAVSTTAKQLFKTPSTHEVGTAEKRDSPALHPLLAAIIPLAPNQGTSGPTKVNKKQAEFGSKMLPMKLLGEISTANIRRPRQYEVEWAEMLQQSAGQPTKLSSVEDCAVELVSTTSKMPNDTTNAHSQHEPAQMASTSEFEHTKAANSRDIGVQTSQSRSSPPGPVVSGHELLKKDMRSAVSSGPPDREAIRTKMKYEKNGLAAFDTGAKKETTVLTVPLKDADEPIAPSLGKPTPIATSAQNQDDASTPGTIRSFPDTSEYDVSRQPCKDSTPENINDGSDAAQELNSDGIENFEGDMVPAESKFKQYLTMHKTSEPLNAPTKNSDRDEGGDMDPDRTLVESEEEGAGADEMKVDGGQGEGDREDQGDIQFLDHSSSPSNTPSNWSRGLAGDHENRRGKRGNLAPEEIVFHEHMAWENALGPHQKEYYHSFGRICEVSRTW